MQSNIIFTQSYTNLFNLLLNDALIAAEAKSGCIMIADKSSSRLIVKNRLGEPSIYRATEQPYDTNISQTIAANAYNNKKYIISNDTTTDEEFNDFNNPGRSSRIQSILCVPMINNEEVFGVINADSNEKNAFTEKHAEDVGIVINKYMSEIINRTSLTEALSEISKFLISKPIYEQLSARLIETSKRLLSALGADLVIIYEYDESEKRFILREDNQPIYSGNLLHPESFNGDVFEEDFTFQMLRYNSPIFIEEGIDKQYLLTEKIYKEGENSRERFSVREKIVSLAALRLSIKKKNEVPGTSNNEDTGSAKNDDSEIVGVMFINFRKVQRFFFKEREAIMAFANVAANSIYFAREEGKSRNDRSGIMNRINSKIKPGYILKNSKDIELDVQNYLKTFDDSLFVLSADIRRSTEVMLHCLDSKSYVKFIYDLERVLSNIIRDFYGVVDKFTGDGILAYFLPVFSGAKAGSQCLYASIECIKAFTDIYSQHGEDFQLFLDDAGLSVGIDYGQVSLNVRDGQLIAVGSPIVFASRLSSAISAKEVVLNGPAFNKVLEENNTFWFTQTSVNLKHQGLCRAFKLEANGISPTHDTPDWIGANIPKK